MSPGPTWVQRSRMSARVVPMEFGLSVEGRGSAGAAPVTSAVRRGAKDINMEAHVEVGRPRNLAPGIAGPGAGGPYATARSSAR